MLDRVSIPDGKTSYSRRDLTSLWKIIEQIKSSPVGAGSRSVSGLKIGYLLGLPTGTYEDHMNPALLKASVALMRVSLLIIGSGAMFRRRREWRSLLQLLGAGFLVVVVLVHLCEAAHLFPWMNWGAEQSAGHYLDLLSAILGFVLFPAGYLLYAVTVPRR